MKLLKTSMFMEHKDPTLKFKNFQLGDPFPDDGVDVLNNKYVATIDNLGDGQGIDSRDKIAKWNKEAKILLSFPKMTKGQSASTPIDRLKSLLADTENGHTFGVETYNGWLYDEDAGYPSYEDWAREVLTGIYIKTTIILNDPSYFSK